LDSAIYGQTFIFFNGKNTVSPILDKIAFGNYNARIENPRTKYDWLSKDETNVSMYMMDKWCGIDLKNSFYCDMLSGLKQIHKISNIKKIPVDLPLLLFYGSDLFGSVKTECLIIP